MNETLELSKLELKLLDVVRDIVRHGYGSVSVSSSVMKDRRRKVVIQAGREYVFFVDEPLTSASPVS